MGEPDGRRGFLFVAGVGVGAVLTACRNEGAAQAQRATTAPPAPSAAPSASTKQEPGEDVDATEDLMREHGVIRRILVVYRQSAVRLRTKPTPAIAEALQKSASLMRTFGEDYHEKQLEETYLFPAVKRAGGRGAAEIDTLIAQHRRGREITDYVLATTRAPIGAAAIDPLARTLEAFALMYEEHAAREDTIVFPAWRKTLTPSQFDELGDKFEQIEKQTFGKDGFDDAVDKVADIEHAIGLDLGALTAPPPPKA